MALGDDVLGAVPLGDLGGFALPVQVNGQYQVSAFSVPIGSARIKTGLDRAAFGSLTGAISWSVEVSPDAGQTWLSCGSATTLPGDFIEDGEVSAESWIEVPLPFVSDADTRVRCVVDTAETVTTKLNVSAK